MHLSATQAFYLIVNNKSLANMSKTMAEIYREERDEDGFLYMVRIWDGVGVSAYYVSGLQS